MGDNEFIKAGWQSLGTRQAENDAMNSIMATLMELNKKPIGGLSKEGNSHVADSLKREYESMRRNSARRGKPGILKRIFSRK